MWEWQRRDSVSKSHWHCGGEAPGFITHWHILMEAEKHEIEKKKDKHWTYWSTSHPVVVQKKKKGFIYNTAVKYLHVTPKERARCRTWHKNVNSLIKYEWNNSDFWRFQKRWCVDYLTQKIGKGLIVRRFQHHFTRFSCVVSRRNIVKNSINIWKDKEENGKQRLNFECCNMFKEIAALSHVWLSFGATVILMHGSCDEGGFWQQRGLLLQIVFCLSATFSLFSASKASQTLSLASLAGSDGRPIIWNGHMSTMTSRHLCDSDTQNWRYRRISDHFWPSLICWGDVWGCLKTLNHNY